VWSLIQEHNLCITLIWTCPFPEKYPNSESDPCMCTGKMHSFHHFQFVINIAMMQIFRICYSYSFYHINKNALQSEWCKTKYVHTIICGKMLFKQQQRRRKRHHRAQRPPRLKQSQQQLGLYLVSNFVLKHHILEKIYQLDLAIPMIKKYR